MDSPGLLGEIPLPIRLLHASYAHMVTLRLAVGHDGIMGLECVPLAEFPGELISIGADIPSLAHLAISRNGHQTLRSHRLLSHVRTLRAARASLPAWLCNDTDASSERL